jgi:hypothetical protein
MKLAGGGDLSEVDTATFPEQAAASSTVGDWVGSGASRVGDWLNTSGGAPRPRPSGEASGDEDGGSAETKR